MSTTALWRTLRRSWWWLLIGAVVGVLVAGIAFLVLPKTYQSDAAVLVTASTTEADQTATQFEAVSQRLPNYIAMVGSDQVLSAIATKEGVEPADVEQRLTLGIRPDTTVITISAEGSSPEAAQSTAADASAALVEQVTGSSGGPVTMRAQVISEAEPGGAVAPKAPVLLSSGLLAGLLLAFVAALIREARR